MTSIVDKYDGLADGFSEHDYADPARYAARRAELVVELGPRLRAGRDRARPRLRRRDPWHSRSLGYGLRYAGIDASEGMVEAAAARNPGVPFAVARIEDYEPPEPVDATLCLRAFYYPADRVAFFRHVAGYTRRKFVFDFRPRAHSRGADPGRPAGGRLHAGRAAAVLPAPAPTAAGRGPPRRLRARAHRPSRLARAAAVRETVLRCVALTPLRTA